MKAFSTFKNKSNNIFPKETNLAQKHFYATEWIILSSYHLQKQGEDRHFHLTVKET